MALASSSLRDMPVPAPWLTKPPPGPREAPGMTISRLEPRPPIALVTRCCAPSPMEVIMTTAATPMTTPSEVRALRVGWAMIAPAAKVIRSARLTDGLPFVADDQAVAEHDAAPRLVGDLGVMGDDEQRQSLGVELPEQGQDVLTGLAVERPCR